ncbi:hypothetical protein [Mycetocola zhadangensis]|uniref:hypothetical protein n=1 Tax=Mycetocola zhadangensis TaxID=1164595 RepID=UPI0016022002|nr:hypothetical protein [Mycetocola zhadangensis]GGE96116.1 hypothetical protein GCM10011313_18830 [Mycetocola zhadangensis]
MTFLDGSDTAAQVLALTDGYGADAVFDGASAFVRAFRACLRRAGATADGAGR